LAHHYLIFFFSGLGLFTNTKVNTVIRFFLLFKEDKRNYRSGVAYLVDALQTVAATGKSGCRCADLRMSQRLGVIVSTHLLTSE